MPALKKYLSTLLLILIVYIVYFFFHLQSSPAKLNVLGASSNVVLYEEPDSGRQPILDAIASAHKEILVETYLLSDKQIISALEDAQSRGVDVKVMLEEHPVGSGSLNEKTKRALDADGIASAWSNPHFSLTHEKAIVVDDQEVLVLSQNLTASAFTKNREYDVFDVNPADVAEVRNIFIADWGRTSFTPPANTAIIESPDTARAAMTTLMNSAHTSLDLETEDIDDPQVITLLSQDAKKETVRLIVPTIKQLASNQQALQTLIAAGVGVKTISSPYMHAKMLLADDAKAYVGSVNLSTQSLDSNRELGIILTQPDSLQTLQTTFEKDWNDATTFSQ